MKKTLVALAALAATGAFAQVSITGNLTMGYLQVSSTTSTAAPSNTTDFGGLGVDTSQIDFVANEDLGGGMKIVAKMSVAGLDRSMESSWKGAGTVYGKDASLALTTGAGVFTLASQKSADYLSGGIAGVGAVWYDMEYLGLFSARSTRDVVAYAVPVGAITFGVSHQEGSGAANQGLGLGGQGSQVQRLNTYGATYAAGALTVNATLLQFDQQKGGAKDEQRLSGAYDLGVAKLGAGVQITNYDGGAKKTQTLFGANVPMGSLSLGAQWGQRKNDDFAAGNGTQTGYSLAAVYSLSKRTAVAAQYSSWDAVVSPTSRSTAAGVLLSHSF